MRTYPQATQNYDCTRHKNIVLETAKANILNPQKYLEFPLEELSRNRQTPEKLEEVMPWSDKIPEEIKVKNPITK